MRPREREQDPPLPESSPALSTPPPRPATNLSSMVVRPSDTAAGDSETGGNLNRRVNSPGSNPHRRDSCPPSDLRRRSESPPPFRRRGDSPVGFRRRDSPTALRRRGGGGGSPPLFYLHLRAHRFHDNNSVSKLPGLAARSWRIDMVACTTATNAGLSLMLARESGYLPRAGSISPPSLRPRLDDSHYVTNFDHHAAPRFGRGRGGRGGGRFRDVPPDNSLGRGGRSYGRGFNVDQRGTSPLDGEYVHRNDPNLSPREGDWICGNPRCGNLNFARRTYCNNCDEPRFAMGRPGPVHHPQRGYFASPLHGSPSGIGGPPVDRGARRNFNGYRSPPRGWVAEDPREFGTGSPPPPRRGGRFQYHVRRDSRLEYEDEYQGGGNWPVDEEWVRRDGFIPERRGYDRRPPSPLPPRGWWVRERSRSPVGGRPLKGSYMGCGRDDRGYDNPYMGRRRAGDSEMGRGRGFRRTDDSFMGRGRGDPRGMVRGRNISDMY